MGRERSQKSQGKGRTFPPARDKERNPKPRLFPVPQSPFTHPRGPHTRASRTLRHSVMTKKGRKPSVSSGTAEQVADLTWACRKSDMERRLRGQSSLTGGVGLSLVIYRGSGLCPKNGVWVLKMVARWISVQKVTLLP